ncbi:MAG: arsenite methyltransferase [Verrucomicrobia bacterium]|nr:arsenite methyltransferase [Verrucomicrobiota bacterium]
MDTLNRNNPGEIKASVQETYGKIAETNSSGCCSSGCGCSSGTIATEDYSWEGESYDKLDGYVPEADLNLGCGLPIEFAGIEKGMTVLDLGSGAGNDVFIARRETGPEGWVIGLDFTPAMIQKAEDNRIKLGYENIEFIEGDIDSIPVDSDAVDVVVSNCVLNLVPDKSLVLSEIYRVLKKGGHFSISDIVTSGPLPDSILNSVADYVGCVAGALVKDHFLAQIKEAGFSEIKIQKEREISVPDTVLDSGIKVLSVTVYAEK